MQPQTPRRVQWVRTLPNSRLHVRFLDGLEGVVDTDALIHSEQAGVFATLADEVIFQCVSVVYGAVTWPGDIDLAPDAMCDAIKASGEWRLR